MNVLLLGAKGFLGRHTAKTFSQNGWKVFGLGNGSWPDAPDWGVSRWVQGPIAADELNMFNESFDCIINCAGSGSVSFSFENPAQDFARNVTATSVVLEFIRSRQPKAHLICMSSAAVYGRIAELPIREQATLLPASPYGVSKMMSEELCAAYTKYFGVRSTQLRLFSVYGAGLRKQLLWDAANKIVNKKPIFFGTGLETRDWINVSDVTELSLKVALSVDSPPILNGSTAIQTSNRQILTMLAEKLGAESAIEFTGDSRTGDPDHYVGDNRIASGLGWKPSTSLEAGISEYAAWFQTLKSQN